MDVLLEETIPSFLIEIALSTPALAGGARAEQNALAMTSLIEKNYEYTKRKSSCACI
jgi:hypothetical protein